MSMRDILAPIFISLAAAVIIGVLGEMVALIACFVGAVGQRVFWWPLWLALVIWVLLGLALTALGYALQGV